MWSNISFWFLFAFLPWWVMCTASFLCAYLLFLYLLWRNVIQILCLFLNRVRIFVNDFLEFILYWELILLQMDDLQMFSSIMCVAFPSVDSVLRCTKFLILMKSNLSFFVVACAFDVTSKKPLSDPASWSLSSMFSSKSLIVLVFIFIFLSLLN